MADQKPKVRAWLGNARKGLVDGADAAWGKLDEATDEKASKVSKATGHTVRGTNSWMTKQTTRAIERAATTGRGATGLQHTKRGVEKLGMLPGLSAIGDTVQARHGITRLADRLAEDPFDPMPPVWLAEALLRSEWEQTVVEGTRIVLNPFRALFRIAATAVNEAGEEPRVPVTSQLLARAYVLALARLRAEMDGRSLHALGRVYLARGATTEARRLTQGAIATGGDEVDVAAVTLAIAHARTGSIEPARQAAELAIESGSTIGHVLIVELSDLENGADGGLTVDERAALISSVVPADIERYCGIAPRRTLGVFGDVAGQQRERYTATKDWIRDARSNKRPKEPRDG